MDTNFTPLTEGQKIKASNLNVALIGIAALTTVILSVVLFLLISQKIADQNNPQTQYSTAPKSLPTPVPITPSTIPTEVPKPATSSSQLVPPSASGSGGIIGPVIAPSP